MRPKVTVSSSGGGGGLDKLKRDIQEAQGVIESLPAAIANALSTSQHESVETEIRQMEQAVAKTAAPYRSNSLLPKMVSAFKEEQRKRLFERAE